MATNPQLDRTRAELTRLLTAAEPLAAATILPLVYAELRRLAAARLARERSWATLTPTALVHEAYVRLLGDGSGQTLAWNGKGHFFGAAALAMRRILVERARRRNVRPERDSIHDELTAGAHASGVDLLDLDAALVDLERVHPRPYQVVMMRFFAALGVNDTAAALDISVPTVKRDWSFARAWLLARMAGDAA